MIACIYQRTKDERRKTEDEGNSNFILRLSSFVRSFNVYLSADEKKASKKPDPGSG